MLLLASSSTCLETESYPPDTRSLLQEVDDLSIIVQRADDQRLQADLEAARARAAVATVADAANRLVAAQVTAQSKVQGKIPGSEVQDSILCIRTITPAPDCS